MLKKNIMPALFSMLRLYPYAQNYTCIMYLTLNFSWVLQSSRKKSKTDIQTLGGGGEGGVNKVHYGLCENHELSVGIHTTSPLAPGVPGIPGFPSSP